MKPSRAILGVVYRYLNTDVGRSYQEIADFFKYPTRNPVAAGIRDIPKPTKEPPIMQNKHDSVPDVLLRSCVFDIETTNFAGEANIDILTCVTFLPLDEDEPTTFYISYEEMMSPTRDKALLERVIAYMSQFDIVIGHNIAAFDLNWLTTRMLYYGLSFPRSVLYYDTYSAARRIGLKGWKNLGSLMAFFRIPGEKTKIMRPTWTDILHPDRERYEAAMQDTIYHCEQDVLANRKLFNVLWPRDNRMRHLKYYDKWA